MPKNKTPRKSKKPSKVLKNPGKILNRLTVPQERLNNLKRRAETELLRLYMRTGTKEDILSLYTTLQLGKAMTRYIDKPAEAITTIERAEKVLSEYDSSVESLNLDAVKDALDVCCAVWGTVSVNEFVATARELKNCTINN